MIVIAPAVLIGAVGAAAPAPKHTVSADGYMPLAAVARGADDSGVRVIAAAKPIKPLRIAAANPSPPPPPIVFSTMGNMRIPVMALNAYRNAERMMASAYPGCGVSWNLLAGIGRIESLHANGGATDARGTPIQPIYGPTLDGTLAGNEVIVQSVQSGRVTYARAMGPMQFLPGTWARYASDGDNDGKADVQNLFDSTLAAARYLCSGNLNLRDQSQVLAAILRYNNSMAYARNVLGWAAAYQTGVEPVDLPVIGGPPPPISDVHLTTTRGEGLGPGLPPNATGLPATDPLAVTPLFDIGGTNAAGTIGAPAAAPGPLNPGAVAPGGAPAPAAPQQNCQVFCIQGTPAPPPAAVPPPAPAPFAPPLFGPPNPVPAAPFAPPPPPPAPGGLPAEAAPVVPPGPLGQQPGPPPA